MARGAAAAGAQTPGAPGAHTTLTPALKALRTSAAAPGGAADRILRDAAIDEEAECDGYSRAAAGDEEGGARAAAAAAGSAAAAQDADSAEGAGGAVEGEEEGEAQQRRDLPWFRSLADDCLQGGSAAAAAFYADKAVTLSGGAAEDALRLARALAAEGAHRRAAHVLEAHGLLMLSADGGGGYSGAEACALAARCLAAAGRADDCLKLLERVMGEEDADAAAVVARARRDSGGGGGGSGGGGGGGGGGGAGGRVGRVHPLAALCCLRGSMYVEVDSRARAVVWLRAALAADYKCVDALHMLVSRHLLSAPQQEALLASLAFAPCDAALRDLYTSRLGAGALGGAAREAAFAALDRAGLGASTDVLAAKADYLYHRYQDKAALQLCRTVLARDLHNAAVMPAYAACLLEARDKAQLFFTANTLAEEAPGTALALHVLGCYHLLIARWEAAWRLFHKAAQQDSSSALYWVGMGNAAAAQDDSDRAVGAYRAATRACAGSYYPHLYMGMEYLRTNNLGLAGHFLDAARALCRPPPRAPPPPPPPPPAEAAPPPPEDEDEDVDPLLLNEMGVLAYRRGDDARAAALFAAAAAGPARGAVWEPVLANLGHALRRLGRHAEAAHAFERALTLCPTAPSTLTALGFTRHLMGDLDAAVRCYHQALSLRAQDPLASDLLARALEDSVSASMDTALDSIAGMRLDG